MLIKCKDCDMVARNKVTVKKDVTYFCSEHIQKQVKEFEKNKEKYKLEHTVYGFHDKHF